MKSQRWTRKTREGRSRQLAEWLAWAVTVLAGVSGILFLLLLVLNSADPRVETYDYWGASVVMAMVFPVVGALIISRYPAHALGWVLCFIGLLTGVGDSAGEYVTYTLLTEPGALPGGMVAAWLGSFASDAAFVSLPLVLLLFPDGRAHSRRWAPVVWLAASVVLALSVSSAFMPGPIEGHPSVMNPLGIDGAGAALGLLERVYGPIFLACLLAGPASLVIRFRRARGVERQQLKWFAYAAVVGPISLLGNTLLPELAWLIGGVSLALVPVAIGIAVLKYRLYDIDIVINRTLVYSALTAIVVGIYILVVGYLGALVRTEDELLISLVATGIVAVLFAPLRERLQRGVNRLMYGERHDPYAALSRFGQRLESTMGTGALLPTAAGTVAEALNLPYAAIEIERSGTFETTAATSTAEPVAEPVRLPLVYGGETIGRLVIGRRVGETDFSPADRRLLDDLARHVGVAVHAALLTEEAVALSEDLQRSRERLVSAREEERRRLRRDLHDGLGPQLASLAMKAEASRDLLDADPARAEALLEDITAQTQEAVTDVRRLVYGLRPPALDDLGLLGALRAQAAHGDHNGLMVTTRAPVELPTLPAAVEVAAYRIVQESVTNAARHARARTCMVCITPDEEANVLRLEVTDDGRGIPEDRSAGVGLSSMRERAEELGGTCKVEALLEGGTRVEAVLPLVRSPREGEAAGPGVRKA